MNFNFQPLFASVFLVFTNTLLLKVVYSLNIYQRITFNGPISTDISVQPPQKCKCPSYIHAFKFADICVCP